MSETDRQPQIYFNFSYAEIIMVFLSGGNPYKAVQFV